MSHKIYIVEDDAVIAQSVCSHLQSWQMEACCAENFQRITEEIREYEPDLVLMDVKLPYFNGFYLCAEIRKFSKIPIVFLSSADDNMNIVMAMNMGADDFIAKPFDLNVLVAKIQAMLRRTYGMSLAEENLICCGIRLDLAGTAAYVDKRKIELTKNEFLILKMLMERKGRVVTREELMERLWGNDEFVDDNTLTVNITRIRKKFEGAGITELIRTKRGMGYLIEEA